MCTLSLWPQIFNYKVTSFKGQGNLIVGRPPGAPQTLGSHWITPFSLSWAGGFAHCATLSGRPFTPSPARRPSVPIAQVPGYIHPDGSEMAGNREWEDLGFAGHLVNRAAWTSPSLQAAQLSASDGRTKASHESHAAHSAPDSSNPLQRQHQGPI